MKLEISPSLEFQADAEKQKAWYRQHASASVSARFGAFLEREMERLAENPGLGHPRLAKFSEFPDLKVRRLAKPFDRFLIFYRSAAGKLHLARLKHASQGDV